MFEVKYTDLSGFEYTNSLLEDSCRIVCECKNVTKLIFNQIRDALDYYNSTYNQETIYTPQLNDNRVHLNRVYPFDRNNKSFEFENEFD